MKSTLKLGRLAGIDVFMHWTFPLLIAYIVFQEYHSWESILFNILLILGVFLCVTLHELGHALAARRYGIATLDIILSPIGGVARLTGMPERPLHELIVAIAGPMVNVVIVLLLFPYILFLSKFDTASLADGIIPLTLDAYLNALFYVNILLIVFNIIPAFPMDGGRVLRSLLAMKLHKIKATRIAARVGQFFAIIFMVLGFFYNPFLIFIGLFVFLGAMSEDKMTRTAALLASVKVKDVLRTRFMTLDIHTSIQEAVHKFTTGTEQHFIITEEGRIVGLLKRPALLNALKKKETSNIANLIIKDIPKLRPEQALAHVYQMMLEKRYSILPVLDHGFFVGVLDINNVRNFMDVRLIKGFE